MKSQHIYMSQCHTDLLIFTRILLKTQKRRSLPFKPDLDNTSTDLMIIKKEKELKSDNRIIHRCAITDRQMQYFFFQNQKQYFWDIFLSYTLYPIIKMHKFV